MFFPLTTIRLSVTDQKISLIYKLTSCTTKRHLQLVTGPVVISAGLIRTFGHFDGIKSGDFGGREAVKSCINVPRELSDLVYRVFPEYTHHR